MNTSRTKIETPDYSDKSIIKSLETSSPEKKHPQKIQTAEGWKRSLAKKQKEKK